jgi:DNA-binding NarL/FixJ family response regulator
VTKPSPAQSLTRRHIDILTFMALGFTNAEIARELFVSEDTVKTHAKRIYQFLGAEDRANAVAIAVFRGHLVLEDNAGRLAVTGYLIPRKEVAA